ncbi:MAG: MFS transporter [Betaproteobacteria bacterium]
MRRDVFLLSLAAFASAASLRATDPLLPLIAADFQVSSAAASAAVTSFTLSYGLFQIVCGPLGDRFGRYATIAAAAFVASAGSLACALAGGLDALVIARFVAGGVVGAFIPLSLAWIGDSFAYERRQAVLARFLIGQMAGLAFGTALAGWLGEHFGWRAIFVALAVFLLVVSALLFMELKRNPAVRRTGGPRPSLRESVARLPRLLGRRDVRALLAAGFTEGLLVFGPLAFVALYLQQAFGVGPGTAGTLLAAYAAGGLVYAFSAKRAVQRLGERGLAALGGAALALGYAGLAFATGPALAALFLCAVGAGFYMFHTTLQAHVTQIAPQQRGSSVALFATFLFVGQASGVWLAARLLEAAGAAWLFSAASAGLALLAFLFCRYFLSARR